MKIYRNKFVPHLILIQKGPKAVYMYHHPLNTLIQTIRAAEKLFLRDSPDVYVRCEQLEAEAKVSGIGIDSPDRSP